MVTGAPQSSRPTTPDKVTRAPQSGTPTTPAKVTGAPQSGRPITPDKVTGAPKSGRPTTPDKVTRAPQSGRPTIPGRTTPANLTGIPQSGDSTSISTMTTSTSIVDLTITSNSPTEKKIDQTKAAPSVYTTSVSTSPVELPLAVTIESSSLETINLTDKSSAQYKNLTETITTDLTALYKRTPGFSRVEVYDLSKGSIRASYTVIFHSAEKLKEVIGTIKEKVLPDLLKQKIAGGTVNENKTRQMMEVIINEDSTNNICSFLKQPVCKYGYFCASHSLAAVVSCVSNCSLHKSICNGHGDCYMDSRVDELKCRCQQDDKYVYSGEYCDIKTEKLGLEKNYIIAIGVGSGGIVVLILLIIITVLLWKRKKENTKDKYIEDTHRSVSMDDLRLQKFENGSDNGYQGYRSRTPTSGNVYESGLPESREQDRRSRTPTARNSYDSESRLVDGKEHKILKDERGSETLIYQPSNLSRPYSTASSHIDAELNSSRPTVYDYIDTDKRYEIQRPKVYGERRYDYEY